MRKPSPWFLVALVVLGVAAVGWHLYAERTGLIGRSYLAKRDLRLNVSDARRTAFVAAVKRFAAQNDFLVEQDLSGLPLKDGRRIVFLMFLRPDGVEFSITDLLHPEEMIVVFYDKMETGNWKLIVDRFSDSVGEEFDRNQV